MLIEMELDAPNNLTIKEVTELVAKICESLEAKVFDLRIRPYCKKL